MRIEAAELIKLELPMVEPLIAAHGELCVREFTLVRVITDVGEGWGECSALNAPGYAPEWAAGEHLFLQQTLVPFVLAASEVSHALPLDAFIGHNFAKAALRTALLDAQLKANGASLKSYLGATEGSIACTAVLGLSDQATMIKNANRMHALGYRSFKLKIAPGEDVQSIDTFRQEFPDVELRVDANGSYDWANAQHRARLQEIADRGVAVEQPLAPGNVAAYGDLRESLDMMVALDESITSVASAADAVALNLCDTVVVKPPRLGGPGASKEVHDLCRAKKVSLSLGGMVDGAIGRSVACAVASMPGFEGNAAEIAPDGRWFAESLAMEPAVMNNGRLTVPDSPGIGVELNHEVVARRSTQRQLLRR